MREDEIKVSCKLGDTAVHMASVVMEMVEQMLNYCKEHSISMDFYEKKQWIMLLKCTKALNGMLLDYPKEQRMLFNRNVKMISLLMRLILARVDDDDLKLYKWYNYIKSFPADFPEIQPTADEEMEAFKHLFQ